METVFRRRDILKSIISIPALIIPGTVFGRIKEQANITNKKESSGSLKISLNAFSFNEQLLNGSIRLDDLLEVVVIIKAGLRVAQG